MISHITRREHQYLSLCVSLHCINCQHSIYVELAEQYRVMDAVSDVSKRNILAQHLKEVVDVLEQKVLSCPIVKTLADVSSHQG